MSIPTIAELNGTIAKTGFYEDKERRERLFFVAVCALMHIASSLQQIAAEMKHRRLLQPRVD